MKTVQHRNPDGRHTTIFVDGSVRIGDGATLGDGVCIGKVADIHCGATLGGGVTVGEGATVWHDAIIGDDAFLGPLAVVERAAIVGAYAILGIGASIGAEAVVGPWLRLGAGVRVPLGVRLAAGSCWCAGRDMRDDEIIGYLDPAGLLRILCGCRHFTLAEARAHWGAPDCPNKTLARNLLARLDYLETVSQRGAEALGFKLTPISEGEP